MLVAAGVVAAAMLITAFLILGLSSRDRSASNGAEQAAAANVQRMYEQDLAAAQAGAALNEQIREEELNTVGAILNTMGNDSAELIIPEIDIPAIPENRMAAPVPENVAEAAPVPAPGGRFVTSKDGGLVDVQGLIDSVKAEGTRPEGKDKP